MTFGEKISKLRKEQNYTQEQLAELLDVSRQSVSKWEQDTAYPETDKILKIAHLFNCTCDYLLKDEITVKSSTHSSKEKISYSITLLRDAVFKERISTKKIMGLPLYHVGRNAHAIFAVGIKAKGVFSLGILSKGICSAGLLSLGLFSIGVFSLGLLSCGIFALGIFSLACIALGVFSIGAISFGIVSLGALSIGCFSSGALAIGKYIAVGDYAYGDIAIGIAKAKGELYILCNPSSLDAFDIIQIEKRLCLTVPDCLEWAKNIFMFYLK